MLSQALDLDYLTMDYLAEVSMSILAMQRQRDAKLGYPQDFVDVVRSLAPYWANAGKCRLIANAGGLNPLACARACATALEETGCRSMKIGVVSGDDVLELLLADNTNRESFRNLDSQAPFTDVRDRLVTANAYLGSSGIVAALQSGAEIVITGRIADPSLVVAPCIYEFGWDANDWDRIAGATVAGHLLECGTHVTGGISTDWLSIPDPAHIGFPIAEIETDGQSTITKPIGSGGRVTPETVKEQLLYEIGDPEYYLSPDVSLSFQNIRVESVGIDRVRVTGAKGRSRPTQLKVSATYRDGYRAAGMLTIFGPDAVSKGRRCGEIVLHRLREAGFTFRDSVVECLGSGESVPVLPSARQFEQSFETVLRIAVESDSKDAVEHFSKEMIPLVTAGPQGTTGYAEGRPRVHSIFRYWPCLIDADKVPYALTSIESKATLPTDNPGSIKPWLQNVVHYNFAPAALATPTAERAESRYRTLCEIAYGRSGDKGSGANIGILARSSEVFTWLQSWLTKDRVREYFSSIGVELVVRYELPKIEGFNFVIRGILRRGLRNDAQGKALAQALLAMPIDDSAPQTPF